MNEHFSEHCVWHYLLLSTAMNKDEWDPEFLKAIPIMKTRSGMQFSCASPSHSSPENVCEVWVCNSDGYVGQVCVLSIRAEPTVEACIAVCSARIICIAAVPGLKSRSVYILLEASYSWSLELMNKQRVYMFCVSWYFTLVIFFSPQGACWNETLCPCSAIPLWVTGSFRPTSAPHLHLSLLSRAEWFSSSHSAWTRAFWKWWLRWRRLTKPFIYTAEPSITLHHLIQLRQWVMLIHTIHALNLFI